MLSLILTDFPSRNTTMYHAADNNSVLLLMNGIWNLVMQRQPAPRADWKCTCHFLCRTDALKKFSNDDAALVGLLDLPSNVSDPENEETKKRARQDTDISKLKISGAGTQKESVHF